MTTNEPLAVYIARLTAKDETRDIIDAWFALMDEFKKYGISIEAAHNDERPGALQGAMLEALAEYVVRVSQHRRIDR